MICLPLPGMDTSTSFVIGVRSKFSILAEPRISFDAFLRTISGESAVEQPSASIRYFSRGAGSKPRNLGLLSPQAIKLLRDALSGITVPFGIFNEQKEPSNHAVVPPALV